MFDWNPDERCQVLILVTNLPAGVPSLVKLTPWKESALKALALHRRQGFITAKQIAAHGVGKCMLTTRFGDYEHLAALLEHELWSSLAIAR